MFSNRKPLGSHNKLNITLVLPEFDGPEIIHLIESGSKGPCLPILFMPVPTYSSKLSTGSSVICFTTRISKMMENYSYIVVYTFDLGNNISLLLTQLASFLSKPAHCTNTLSPFRFKTLSTKYTLPVLDLSISCS